MAVAQLRTLPEDIFDHQPEFQDDVAVVADIRLDNRDALVAALGLDPRLAGQLPDSGLLRCAWRKWGSECLHHLVGDYAFVIWSAREHVLFAARDPVGLRPLVHAVIPGGLVIASQPSLVAGPGGVAPAVDAVRMAQWLAFLRGEPERTCFHGVSRLPPGHSLRLADGRVTVSRYWKWAATSIRYRRRDEYVEHFGELLDRAVRARCRSSVRVATHLSGGLDSGAVTAIAARMLAPGAGPLTAVTWQPRGPILAARSGRIADETSAATRLAAMYPNISHVVVQAPEISVLSSLRRLAMVSGELPATVWNSPYHFATAHALGGGPATLLTGQHGNLAASYGGPRPPLQRLAMVLQSITAAWRWRPTAVSLMTPAFARAHAADLRPARRRWTSVGDQVQSLAERDPGGMAGALGAMSIDVRDPTADVLLVDFCLSIPGDQFGDGSESRLLIRRALRGRIPDATLDGTHRGQQATDWPRFIAPYRQEFAHVIDGVAQSPLAREVIDLNRLRDCMRQWPEHWTAGDYGRIARPLARACAMGDFTLRWDRQPASTA